MTAAIFGLPGCSPEFKNWFFMECVCSTGRDAGMMHPQAKTAQKNLHGECDGWCSPGCAGENHFVRKQRTPFVGGSMVVRRAANDFVPAILAFDEASGAESGDKLSACAM